VKLKSLAELQKLHDKLVVESVVLQQKIDALMAAQRKPKRAKK
jgi:hypothetical protein